MATLIRWRDLPEKEIHQGHYRCQVEYPTCYVALHRYTADGEGYAPHSHPETQAGYVLTGEMAMLFEDAAATVAEGQSYVIPTALRHGGKAASQESVVINLYVKRHLVPVPGDPVLHTLWRHGAPAVTASGVRQSLFDVPPGASAPAPTEKVEDSFDIVISGELEGLGKWDAIRHEGASTPPAGTSGARIFRVEILARPH
jgi:quercetin dioxygenase-like cupin family protein